MKVEWLRTVHVQFLFKSELLCYAKNVDSASFVSFRNNINVKLNLKMRVMRNKKKTLIISLVLLACFASSACAVSKGMKKVVDEALDFSVKQSMSMFSEMQGQVGILPRTAKDGKMITCESPWWTSGFYPGTLWYCYEYSNDPQVRAAAEEMTSRVEKQKYTTSNHDVGFIINCSFGNGYRLTHNEAYREVIETAAKSLSTRFHPVTGCTRSWNSKKWQFSVIIDNMMNLELMFEATRLSGDSTFYDIARKHADTTMANHFRADNSCYHVVDYDPETGEVRKKQTAQGYADESAWARGQAWALYGYTMCYRYTHDVKYLEQAEKIYGFIFNNKNLPEDLVPYWDFDAPKIPDEPRDASAAACTASALYELSTYIPGKGYKEKADKIMESLASPAYRAEVGTNGNFILMHSVGSIPHGAEIDVPLNYADYYFLEALMRKRDLEK